MGIIGLIVGYLRAHQAATVARTEADKAEAINDFLTQDLLVQVEPGNNQVVNRVTLQEVLDRAADRVEERFRDRPEIESSLRWTIGQTYHGLGAYAKAEQHLRGRGDRAASPGGRRSGHAPRRA